MIWIQEVGDLGGLLGLFDVYSTHGELLLDVLFVFLLAGHVRSRSKVIIGA